MTGRICSFHRSVDTDTNCCQREFLHLDAGAMLRATSVMGMHAEPSFQGSQVASADHRYTGSSESADRSRKRP